MATKANGTDDQERRSARRLKRERVLVTSASGGLGRLVCRRLHRRFDVIGVDKAPFVDRPKDVEHYQVDLRRKAAMLLLKKKKPDVVIHIGGIHGAPSPGGRANRLVDATVQLLKLVELVRARKLVLVSTAMLYGPSSTSASFLTEEAPLLGAGSVPDLGDDISLDMMVQSFFWKRPETETVILRPVHVVGPHLDNLATRYLRGKRIPKLLGFDPMIQLMHEDDLVRALELAIEPGVRGIFNITGQTQAPLSRLIHARGASTVPIPGPLFSAGLGRARALRLSAVDPGELEFLRYSFLVDGARAERELRYTPERTLQQTIHDLE